MYGSGRLRLRQLDQARQRVAVARAEAGVRAVEVVADRADRQGELLRDLAVAQAGGREGDDLPLAGGEFAEDKAVQGRGAGALAAPGQGDGSGAGGSGGTGVTVRRCGLGVRLRGEEQETALLQCLRRPVEGGTVVVGERLGVFGEDTGQPADGPLGRAEPDGVVRILADRAESRVEIAAGGGPPGDRRTARDHLPRVGCAA